MLLLLVVDWFGLLSLLSCLFPSSLLPVVCIVVVAFADFAVVVVVVAVVVDGLKDIEGGVSCLIGCFAK